MFPAADRGDDKTRPTCIELHTVSLQGHLCSEQARWGKIKRLNEEFL